MCTWKFQYILNEIRFFASSLQVKLFRVLPSANEKADSFAKKGVDKYEPFEGL